MRDGSGGHTLISSVADVDPDQYDDGSGTLATVANNKFTIQRIYLSAISTFTLVEYGQNVYDTLEAANAALFTAAHVANPVLTANATHRCWMIVKKSTTDLTDTANAAFIEAPALSGAIGGTGTAAIAAATLQSAYEASTMDEIVLDDTKTSPGITIRDSSTPVTGALLHIEDDGATTHYFEVTTTETCLGTNLTNETDSTYSIGATAKRWDTLWVDNIMTTNAMFYGADAGSDDAYTITLSPAPTSLVTGQRYHFQANTINTGAATLDINGLGAKAILKNHDVVLVDGDIEANQLITVIYDGTQFQMQSQLGNESSGGSGANTALSNLSSVAINESLISDTDSTDNLGSTGIRWSTLWVDSIMTTTAMFYAADSGSTDSYAITLSPAPTALVTGQTYHFRANTANTGSATLNINGTGSKPILKNHGNALSDGDIGAQQIISVVYDGTEFQMQSLLGNEAAFESLSNLENVAINTSLISDTDGTDDLGSTGIRWANLWVDDITVTTNITIGGTVDGRDIATDGTKLDGVETLADVTDETNVVSSLNGATLTAVTVASTDKVVVQDVSDSDNIKTVTAQSIADLGGGGGSQNLWETITADTGSATADSTTDSFDLAGGEGIATSITLDVATFDLDLPSLGNQTNNTIDLDNDEILIYDTSVTTHKKVPPAQFHHDLIQRSASMTAAVISTSDSLPILDSSIDEVKKITADVLGQSIIQGATSGTIALTDEIIWGDTSGAGVLRQDTVQGVVDLTAQSATQSDQETGTSTTTFVSPGTQEFHQSAAKAWVAVSYSGGVPTNDASYNVASIADTAVGVCTINITTDFSSANYAISVGSEDSTDANAAYFDTQLAGSFRLIYGRVGVGQNDPLKIHAQAFGDHLMDKLIYTNLDGTVSIVIPNGRLNIETVLGTPFVDETAYEDFVISRSIPSGVTNIRSIDDTDIPSSREFRDAWVDTEEGTQIDIDCGKAQASVLVEMKASQKIQKKELYDKLLPLMLDDDTSGIAQLNSERNRIEELTTALEAIDATGKVNDTTTLNLIRVQRNKLP